MGRNKEFDFEFSKRARKILDTLDSYILNQFGERCKRKGQGCEVCKMWAIRDLVAMNVR